MNNMNVMNSGNINLSPLAASLQSTFVHAYHSNSDMSAFDDILWQRKPASSNILDVSYPLDLDLSKPTIKFHVSIWKMSLDANQFWEMIDFKCLPNSNLAFSKRKFRNEFSKWWLSYSNRFFSGIYPYEAFLPPLTTGKISGVFVKCSSSLDTLANFNTYPAYEAMSVNPNPSIGLLELLPSWSWIVSHCKKAVHKIQGGWIFTSPAEAAQFVLFDPNNTEKSLA